MRKNNLKKFIYLGIIAFIGTASFSSCEDDSLPEAGSIPDVTPPTGAFAVSAGNTSSLVKVFRNTSLSATGGTWSFPEGSGTFISECEALGTAGCSREVSTNMDEQVFYKFDEFGTYDVGIIATDALNVSSELSTAPVIVETTNAPLPTVSFEVEQPDGVSNFQRILTSSSANANGGVFWSVSLDGETVPLENILVADGSLAGRDEFTAQTAQSESIFVSFIGAGDYQVTLTAENFDGETDSLEQSVVVDPLTEPVPTFIYSSNEDYTVQTFTNTTPDTDRVIWALPDGGDFVGGTTETSNDIQVSFPSSGEYNIQLTVISVGFDENDTPVDLDGTTTLVLPIVTSVAEIAEPTIYRGGFEPGTATNPADASNQGVFRNDLGKEWWIADGVSDRVYLLDTPDGTVDPNMTIIDTGLENESWFGPASGFNRLNITGNARSGARAASFDPTRPTRIAVQEFDVTPGADYKITYFVNNVSALPDAGLKVFILDSSVANDEEANSIENIIDSRITDNDTAAYVEESLSFNAGDNTSVKLYFYPTDPTAGTFYLDDVSIAID